MILSVLSADFTSYKVDEGGSKQPSLAQKALLSDWPSLNRKLNYTDEVSVKLGQLDFRDWLLRTRERKI